MKKHSPEPSDFANALRHLLDGTGIYSRAEWAELLGVSPPAISQWLNDVTLPRPEILRMIVDVINESDHAPEAASFVRRFKRMAMKPGHQVSPHGERLGKSANHYIIRPILETFLRRLEQLDPEIQEEILLNASLECARRAGHLVPAQADPELPGEPLPRAPMPPAGKGLPDDVIEAAEAAIARLGEKADALFDEVLKHLTGSVEESLRQDSRRFCTYALACTMAYRQTSPMSLMTHIIAAQVVDGQLLGRPQFWKEALNAVFLAVQDTSIVVKQPGGGVAALAADADVDIESSVTAIRHYDVQQYVLTDCLPYSYQRMTVADITGA